MEGMEGHPDGKMIGDRLLTDEVNSVENNMMRIAAFAAKGDIDSIKMPLRTVEGNWEVIRTELQARGENKSINSFEESIKSLKEALDRGDRSEAVQAGQRLSAAFAEVKASLAKTEVDVPRFITTLSYFSLAWFSLTLVATEVMKRGNVRL